MTKDEPVRSPRLRPIVGQNVGMSAFSDAVARVTDGADPKIEGAALVAQMTLDEKLGCLDGDLPFWPGLFDMISGGYYRHTWPAAVVERLGIPGLQFSDGPRGCVVGHATCFPVSMARGATFDIDLERRIGEAIGAELRASGATYTGAVCMNLLRHPAWGRAQETYGEDPHHVGVMATALTLGLQQHVMACMKHFALNSMENARFSVDVTVGERALHEVYLPHFQRVADAGVASVMSAYNSVNGEWCGENATLLTSILRDEWGWTGFVTSDFIFGLRNPVKSVQAGLDIEMPFRQQRARALADAVADVSLDVSAIDASVVRTLTTFLKFNRVYSQEVHESVIVSPLHVALAREAAQKSIVMLRNEGDLLPVAPGAVKRIVVLGRLAAIANLGDGGSSDVHPPYVVTPLDGLRASYPGAIIDHSDDDASLGAGADLVVVVVGYTKDDEGEYIDQTGTAKVAEGLFPPMDDPIVGATAPAAMPPDAPTVLAEDRAAKDRAEGVMAPGGDRSSLRLSPADEALIAAAVTSNPARTVVCVMAGSAVVMPWASTAAAVLTIWYPGIEGGAALGDVISGAAEPGGRLPFAIPLEESHLVHFDREATTETYDLLHGQWKLDADEVAPHFGFGFGLGYTTWKIESLSAITFANAGFGSPVGVNLEVTVTNTGIRSGETVVQVYASIPTSAYERAQYRLVGFARVTADPGQSVDITLSLDLRELGIRDNGGWLYEGGPCELTVSFGRGVAGDRTVLVDL
jgi:beta-glucosidase